MKALMNKKEYGLSLIELMIVVAIIGLLSALSIPKMQPFSSKAKQVEAKQVEAKQGLDSIYALQQSYYGENDMYAPNISPNALCRVGAWTNALLFEEKSIDCYTNTPIDINNPIENCNLANLLGFRVTDCRKSRYAFLTNIKTDALPPQLSLLLLRTRAFLNAQT